MHLLSDNNKKNKKDLLPSKKIKYNIELLSINNFPK